MTSIEQLKSREWRLNNLYKIRDVNGELVTFRMNGVQESFLASLHTKNIILKARQLGMTTFIDLLFLDTCIFNSNISAAIIADTREHAEEIFNEKIKTPYDNLPFEIKDAISAKRDSAKTISFSNGSKIQVSTSVRSGTVQLLHISEYGKISAVAPKKAREIKTGSLNAVHDGNFIFIESTAEGGYGEFYDMCQTAQDNVGDITDAHYKFHFFPWHEDPKYTQTHKEVMQKKDIRYFDELEAQGISLSEEQKNWYIRKSREQGEDMKREFPSTPKEAFEVSIEGAYYTTQLADMVKQDRLGSFPAIDGFPVYTAWDIGVSDSTTITCFQNVNGMVRVVDFYENSGEGLPFYIKYLEDLRAKNGWTYDEHFWPHDGAVREFGSGLSREETARNLGFKPSFVKNISVQDGINAARQILPICLFDKEGAGDLFGHLRHYRKSWDDIHGVWKDKPTRDQHSHAADSFRYMAIAASGITGNSVKVTLPVGLSEMSFNDIGMGLGDLISGERKGQDGHI